MKTFALSLIAGAGLTLACLAPVGPVRAQDAPPAAVAPEQGSFTLRQREDWLNSHLDQARDDGSIDHHEYDRVKHEIDDIHHDADDMRHHQSGELNDNQTAELEARLDRVGQQIHWLHEHSWTPPW